MFEIVKSGGLMMVPLILCSIIAVAIILERVWTLQKSRVVPPELAEKVWRWVESRQIQEKHIVALRQNSPLGKILASGLANRHRERAVIKEAIEDSGRHVVHELERYLNALATIAAISPLLGLLGTVFGMVRTFNAISSVGVGNPASLAAGIGEALIGYRYLRRRVDELVVDMEVEAVKLLHALDDDAAAATAAVEE